MCPRRATGLRAFVVEFAADAAKETLAQVQARGADGCVIQADVTRPGEITRMFDVVKSEFGKLDIFVRNARPELAAFYRPPMAKRFTPTAAHR